ncbi:MAG: TIGR01777 family oxidoreductase [Micromonosporaceae bacterium]
MRIVMAGASGFLGAHLKKRLADAGHDVLRLVRREPAGADEQRWAPERRELAPGALTGADAVVNLAGAGVGDRRWNDAYKERIRASRIDPTATLAETLARMPAADRPAVLLNSSAVGFYGDTGDTAVDEDSPAGSGFLADVCRMWEAATGPAADAGVRVVLLRTGLPLDADGGLLKSMLPPFRSFLGGRLGSGRQWMPWISLGDWLDATRFLLDHADIGGPVNVVGPAPVRNEEFTRRLAALVHRPVMLPVPRFALRIALGEFGSEAVASVRVLPGVLSRAGFAFRQPDLASALRAALHLR